MRLRADVPAAGARQEEAVFAAGVLPDDEPDPAVLPDFDSLEPEPFEPPEPEPPEPEPFDDEPPDFGTVDDELRESFR
ncbi:hypothetical protein GCM10028784_30430 [Myceligenerans cantabricum]